MDSWLANLQSEGTVDSAGEFVLDLSAGLRVLRYHQLSDPRTAILHVVRAAVLSGAEWLSLRTSPGECEAEFPGVLAPSPEYPGMLRWLFQEASSPRLPLALAVNSALGFYSSLELTSWDGELCARLRMSAAAGHAQIGREPPWREPRTRLRLLHARPGGFLNASRAFEHALVAQACAWAPLRLTLDHQLLQPAPFGAPRAPELRIYARRGEPHEALRLPPTRSRRCLSRVTDDLSSQTELEEGEDGILVAALSLRSGKGAWLKNGVRLGELSQNAIVSAAGLGLDVGQERLDENGQARLTQRLAEGFRILQGP
jgi:hypothetical protein